MPVFALGACFIVNFGRNMLVFALGASFYGELSSMLAGFRSES
jgi:hypothetical protein